MLLEIQELAQAVQGSFIVKPQNEKDQVNSLVWDSREVAAGNVYVALQGERVDGHNFVTAALQSGAKAILVMQHLPEDVCSLAKECNAAIIAVEDTFAAITQLACAWREHINARIIGLTGSSGKTTTKNLLRQVLSAQYKVVATKANQNNELGVPKTLLNAETDTDFLVVEMGMRGLGQIAELCDFVRPHIGLVVNAGESHIELLGGRENIARAKAELYDALPDKTGIALVNEANDFAEFMEEHSRLRERHIESVYFGAVYQKGEEPVPAFDLQQAKRVWAQDVVLDAFGQAQFLLCAQGFTSDIQSQACKLSLRGLHNVSNATAAAATGLLCGMTLSDICAALEKAEPESGRQEFLQSASGVMLINDAYNANPESMRASLAMFQSLQVEGRRIAVLGDMGELGSYAPACHEEIGRYAAQLDLDLLICVGELAQTMYKAACEAGMSQDAVVYMHTTTEVLACLSDYLKPNDAVLVKASHFMELNRVVEGLLDY